MMFSFVSETNFDVGIYSSFFSKNLDGESSCLGPVRVIVVPIDLAKHEDRSAPGAQGSLVILVIRDEWLDTGPAPDLGPHRHRADKDQRH